MRLAIGGKGAAGTVDETAVWLGPAETAAVDSLATLACEADDDDASPCSDPKLIALRICCAASHASRTSSDAEADVSFAAVSAPAPALAFAETTLSSAVFLKVVTAGFAVVDAAVVGGFAGNAGAPYGV